MSINLTIAVLLICCLLESNLHLRTKHGYLSENHAKTEKQFTPLDVNLFFS